MKSIFTSLTAIQLELLREKLQAEYALNPLPAGEAEKKPAAPSAGTDQKREAA